ncbi:peptide chain release factor N(5)-glutamine methyltransferase [Brachyspira hyodysenteriae]|uniref:Protein-(Glutamine-N5) methyltransferase, release factor-specific n=1 Tax=Brachyspira hyodysenteriae ATCC 27164 TaxID=1266923 RepID=A0A3B6VUV6_BRAHO|nr:peptide chain release factor N(5)-glutamine methyltransferase [Brachyspira hyodysenteriae]ANN63368.1 protein-(glutamine-N5) methyltransferase, release factor-specific [Brachyspira hyodysenteriae ATCC 27164]KLI14496.1 modification methylase HemK [Brachyspira hyodysenteriae]KLI24428.1 modification methylase HemK [Brachyspira hyodysenteriae]KLI47401.1 modification methylase HemK [Brachyspira hyodysenteriae]KLI60097.1 modification methylase HemK [Brachyspira hyodysenteriae]
MNINNALIYYSKQLEKINDDYKVSYIEAQTIIMHALNINKIKLISEGLRELIDSDINKIERFINRRINYEPLSYIINKKEFYGLDFYVDNNVLIPRPETEELIDLVLDYTNDEDNILICDIGSGSGNIPITLKRLFLDQNKNIDITAIEISNGAFEVIKKNALNILGDEKIINIINADALTFTPENKFDIIVSNAPYVPLRDKDLLQKDLEFEPQNALYSGYDGLDFYKSFLSIIEKYLKDDGAFFFEIGYDQGEALINICNSLDIKNVSVKKDLSGKDRFLVCENIKNC